ncbi:WecB/TagA/CpsF family glycosyltransferase [Sulfurimonas sp. HSL-3221]|uniref:WecB/TagA/CpsF family glycosyltransferase n=1 Tax=Thiomicrolovo sulfuroxydans TaxID=2894755 RepID=UPI001E649624|nr:WecB/TagA/CpsF family glycosyltransferase [Sulfurimonas sp. HSL-3221]UFS62263.1 WecB/TagA/CpsF family glycosyltransferase [Sulfurimonas sp. HSL-3221]
MEYIENLRIDRFYYQRLGCKLRVMGKMLIGKTEVSTGQYGEFITNFLRLSVDTSSSYVCVVNVHMVMEAYGDESFCAIVNNAEITTPDGMPIAKSMKILYGIEQDRVAGMDIMPDLMKECEKSRKSIFLYGSTDEVLDKIVARAGKEYPNLKIDRYSPPFRVLSLPEKDEIVSMINEKKPDFVFVALGCPKQEKWMAEHKDRVQSCMIGLGGAFEVYAGFVPRAPRWMQEYSLEWFYRLVNDPKRLWKRYLVTNTNFIVMLIKQIIELKVLKKQ